MYEILLHTNAAKSLRHGSEELGEICTLCSELRLFPKHAARPEITKMFRKIISRSQVVQPRLLGASLGSKGFAAITQIRFSSKITATNVSESVLKQAAGPSLHVNHPKPPDFFYNSLDANDIGVGLHRKPETISDTVASFVVSSMRVPVDLFFRKKWYNRGIMLETVAAIPGLVAGSLRHLTSLRKMRPDGGWIQHLLNEAENERMHLLTWMALTQPKPWERGLVFLVQGVFWNVYFLLYLFFPKIAHRVVGYLEEEAVVSYTHMLKAIDEGKIENVAAPEIAINYWNMAKDSKLRDVVLIIRADEAQHRDVNHHFADRLALKKEDLRQHLDIPLEIVSDKEFADKERTIPRVDICKKA